MARYIDADRLLGEMDKRYIEKEGNVPDNLAEGFLQMEILIKKQPTADVAEVVRCKDCVSHTHCFIENHYRFVGTKNSFCCVGKKVQNDL